QQYGGHPSSVPAWTMGDFSPDAAYASGRVTSCVVVAARRLAPHAWLADDLPRCGGSGGAERRRTWRGRGAPIARPGGRARAVRGAAGRPFPGRRRGATGAERGRGRTGRSHGGRGGRRSCGRTDEGGRSGGACRPAPGRAGRTPGAT